MQALSDKGRFCLRSVWNAFLEGEPVFFAMVLVLERKGPNTRQVPVQLYGYISAKIKRIKCSFESASFIGCQ